MVQNPSRRVQEGPRSPPNHLKLCAGKIVYVFLWVIELPIELPIELLIELPMDLLARLK